MRRVHARVEDRDGGSRAVVSCGPRLIGLNQWHALGENGSDDLVLEHAHDVGRRRVEGGERSGPDLERHVRNGRVLTSHAAIARLQRGHDARRRRSDVAPLRDNGSGVSKLTLRHVPAARKIQLDDHAHTTISRGARAHGARHSSSTARLDRRRPLRGQEDAEERERQEDRSSNRRRALKRH